MLTAPGERCRAGVVGSPVGHSLSPVLHGAAHRALGLTGWSFTATEVAPGSLAAHVGALDDSWVGLAVTMPLKEEALALGDVVGDQAVLAGAANTLRRTDGGWLADNTDVPGLATALTEAGLSAPRRATLLGAGATARSALVALHGLGVRSVSLRVRDRARPETSELAERLGLELQVVRLDDGPVVLDTELTDVLLSTLPGGAPAPSVRWEPGAVAPVVMDVAYAPWPSGLARAVEAASGGRVPVVRGTEMLLHQAVRQVELMTGHDGPVEAMRAALQGVEE